MKRWHAFIPRPIKRVTYNKRNQLRAAVLKRVWKLVNLDYQLSGLKIRIENRSDWIIYNEIFVKRLYDPALSKMLETSLGEPLNIVDLGANVGFFALRVAYLLGDQTHPRSFRMTLVEGSPLVTAELNTRIGSEAVLRDKSVIVHGLIGERHGSAKIYESASFGAGNSLFATNIPEGVEVPFVDLSAALAGDDRIDLLKCDIEGSELSFVENYPDLLAKAKVAVFEFHPEMCDVERCQQLLREAGFVNKQALASDVTLFWKSDVASRGTPGQ